MAPPSLSLPLLKASPPLQRRQGRATAIRIILSPSRLSRNPSGRTLSISCFLSRLRITVQQIIEPLRPRPIASRQLPLQPPNRQDPSRLKRQGRRRPKSHTFSRPNISRSDRQKNPPTPPYRSTRRATIRQRALPILERRSRPIRRKRETILG